MNSQVARTPRPYLCRLLLAALPWEVPTRPLPHWPRCQEQVEDYSIMRKRRSRGGGGGAAAARPSSKLSISQSASANGLRHHLHQEQSESRPWHRRGPGSFRLCCGLVHHGSCASTGQHGNPDAASQASGEGVAHAAQPHRMAPAVRLHCPLYPPTLLPSPQP